MSNVRRTESMDPTPDAPEPSHRKPDGAVWLALVFWAVVVVIGLMAWLSD